MGRSQAQKASVTMGGGDQNVSAGQASSRSTAQAVTVTRSTNVQVVLVNPAQKIPTE